MPAKLALYWWQKLIIFGFSRVQAVIVFSITSEHLVLFSFEESMSGVFKKSTKGIKIYTFYL
jgi:hypothetical protein